MRKDTTMKLLKSRAKPKKEFFVVNLTIRNDPNIGRRLKFKVLTMRVKIVVGNPVTYCVITEKDGVDCCRAISICNPKDKYNWKIGVKEAFANAISDFPASDRKLFYFHLFKKYPELKSN